MKIKILVLICSLFLENTAIAEIYTPIELYNVDYYQLQNGLELYLQPRDHANNVSIRLSYKVGHKDFPCDIRETAHYLEHLLFTGTSKHTEIELDELFKKYGGIPQASTADYQTTYEADVHNKYTIPALKTYFEMLTDSIFTDDNVITTKDIIYREGDGKSTGIRRWLYSKNIFKHGIYLAYESLFSQDEFCQNLDYFENITKQIIVNAYTTFYVPNNMAIFVIGNFNKEKVLNEIKKSFGKLKLKDIKRRVVNHNYPKIVAKRVESTLIPIFGSEATVTFLFRVPGHKSKDETTFLILTEYLSNELYNIIRVKQGLAYTPLAEYRSEDSEGLLSLSADIEVNDIERTIKVMTEIITDIRNAEFSEKKLKEIQEYYLLNLAMGIESNSSIVELYTILWRDFEHKGKFDDLELKIKSVTTSDLDRVIKKYIDPEKLVIAIDRPTLSYTQLLVIIGLFILVIGYFGIKKFSKITNTLNGS